MTSLYSIAEDYSALQKLDPSETDPTALFDTLEGLRGALEEKGKSIAALFQNWEADINSMKDAEKRMAARRKALEGQADRLKRYLLENMEKSGIDSISCPEFEVKVVANPTSVVVAETATVPEKYTRTKVSTTPDKKALKEAIESGEEFVGISLEKKNRLKIT